VTGGRSLVARGRRRGGPRELRGSLLGGDFTSDGRTVGDGNDGSESGGSVENNSSGEDGGSRDEHDE